MINPCMQIRRLRHVQGQFGIYGEIINVPVAVYTMFHICQASRDCSFFILMCVFHNKPVMQLGFETLRMNPSKKNAKSAALVGAGFEFFKQKSKERKPVKWPGWQ